MNAIFMILLLMVALVLIVLVLVQRGKGGGLAGAFGGMGGQSAFGTKAGDTFTKITIGVACVWILLCLLGIKMLGPAPSLLNINESEGLRAAPSSEEEGTSKESVTKDPVSDEDAPVDSQD